MTKATDYRMTKLLTLALMTGALGLAGCASPTPAKTTAGAGAGASPRVAATGAPGTGKGHWEVESSPMVGTFARRRVWVPDDGSAPVVAPSSSTGETYAAPAPLRSMGNGRSLGGPGI